MENINHRFDALDILRSIAILHVVITHGAIFLKNVGPLPNLIISTFAKINFGVPLFFILSGFLITYKLHNDDDIYRFYTHRFAKIYPMYFLLITLICYFKPVQGIDYFLHILCIHNWFNQNMYSISFQLWSIAVEMQFYLIIPYIHKKLYPLITLRHIFLWGIMVSVLAINYITSGALTQQESVARIMMVYGHTLTNISCLFLGMVLFKKYTEGVSFKRSNVLISVLIILIVLLGFSLTYDVELIKADFTSKINICKMVLLIMCWQFPPFFLSYKILEMRISGFYLFKFIAKISYQWYLIHVLILDSMWMFVEDPYNVFGFILYMLISFSIAAVLTFLLEEPIQKKLRKYLLKRYVVTDKM